jgi:glycosyltransferase involved in cell wall biosynthesis
MTAQTDVDRSGIAQPTTSQLRLDGVRVLVLFGGSELFGQERANLEVFRSLSELGLKARFITSDKWGGASIRPEIEAHDFECVTAPYGYQWGKFLFGKEFYLAFANLWGIIATSWRVQQEVQTWRPTHIYAPNWAYWLYAAPAVALSGKPFIFRAGDQLPLHTAFHRWTGRKMLSRADCVICNSRFLASKFMELGVPTDKLRVIYNRPPRRRDLTDEAIPEVPAGAVLVVFAGQISEHKGAPLFVEAARKMLSIGRNAVFWLIGESSWDNTLAERLKAEVKAGGCEERIQFLGYRRNMPQILRAADIHVCPSIGEDASPNVILEAKKEGVPTVAFAAGGIPELIDHRQDGYICQKKTVEGLIEGIEYFLCDPARRSAAGAAAQHALAQKFNEEQSRREWGELFLASAPFATKAVVDSV